MSAAVYFFSTALSWTDCSNAYKKAAQKSNVTASFLKLLVLLVIVKSNPCASGVMESMIFPLLFVSAHSFKYLCASSALPLAKSHRADSGSHLKEEPSSVTGIDFKLYWW